MLRPPMASSHCPNPECPFLAKYHQPADYREGFTTCSDCGSTLVAGPAPVRAPAQAAVAVAAEPMLAVPRVEGATGDVVRRVGVSLAVLVAAALCQQVMLPGLSPSWIEMMAEMGRAGLSTDSLTQYSVFALGLQPLVSAFVLVELAALLVPAWRPLRTSGPRARARLRTAAVVLGLLFAFVQAFALTRLFESLNVSATQSVFSQGGPPMPVIALLMAGAVVFLHLLTVVVERQGLGNGYAVVLLGLALPTAFALARKLATEVSADLLPIGPALLLVLGLVALVRATTRLLRGRLPGAPTGTERPAALRLPTSGLAPLTFTGALLALPTTLASLGVHPALHELAQVLQSSFTLHTLMFFVLTVLATVAFSVLFNRPQRVGATWAALTAKDEASRAEVHGRAALRARELLPSAVAWSLLLVSLAWLPSRLASVSLRMNLPEAGAVLFMVAIGLDLLDEVKLRLEGGWTAVWPVHRVYEVEPALAALTAAGIPARARGAHTRALFHFFAPYFAIDLMVPPERAEEARTLLEAARRP